MKKLLVILILTLTLTGHSQNDNYPAPAMVSNPVVDVAIFKSSDATGIENALIVPEGAFATIPYAYGNWYWGFPDDSDLGYLITNSSPTVLPEGYKFFSSANNNSIIIVYLHEYASTGSTFSYTEAELDNSVKLFPNPTTSEVALNSEKTYEIEVFDILGNKVMELVGNSINMEHLSNATYIVNALDVESRESLSYKVIKK